MKTTKLCALILAVVLLGSCQRKSQENKQADMEKSPNPEHKYVKGSFGYDLNFLMRMHDNDENGEGLIILKNNDARVIVSSKYQGKVFTSTAKGLNGKSFGWINYKAFDKPEDPHMNAYGGENRFWLGPEGSRFSIFFKPEQEMIFENWVTPPSFDTESWNIISADEQKVSLDKEASLLNYAGTVLRLKIKRDIQILKTREIEEILDIKLNEEISSVGYKTNNQITNTGDNVWSEETGAPCIWMLDMFTPSSSTVIMVPYHEEASGKIATTDYFGEIPEDRIKYIDGLVLFKADGQSRGKIGIPPQRAKSIAGSYDEKNGILTVTHFDVDPDATYLNQEWRTDKDPFSGDVVNAYNDGPLEDGSQMGPFYEVESVSPAAFLKPGEKLDHEHSVFHFTGDKAALNEMIEKLFGTSAEKIRNVMND